MTMAQCNKQLFIRTIMNKRIKSTALIIMFFAFQFAKAQVFSNPPHVIDDDARGGVLSVGDINSDGSQDIIFVSSQLLVWYENDGMGNFSESIIIDTEPGQSFDVKTVDLNQDGFLDILVSSFAHDRVYWYRNLGGGNFAPRQVLAENLDRIRSTEVADLNGNGYFDLVIGITNGLGFYWMEHLDGLGSFTPPVPVSTTLSQARSQQIGDINGDGTLDILSNSGGSILLSWFENTDGQGDFSTQHIIESSGFYNISLFLIDIDIDNDLDIVSYGNDGVFWYENLDGLGNFSSKQTINPTTDPNVQYSQLYPFDINNDGTIDVVYLSTINNGINYQFNDGSGNFGLPFFVDPPQGITSGGNSPIDIDGDGDKDLINIAAIDGDPTTRILWWYENQTILNIQELTFKSLTITPNPVAGVLSIKSKTPLKKVSFYQSQGKSLKTVTSAFEIIDITSLTSGVYFVFIEGQNGERVVKTVIKK